MNFFYCAILCSILQIIFLDFGFAAGYYNVTAAFVSPLKLTFTTATQSLYASNCSGIATVEVRKGGGSGVAFNVAGNLTLNISGTTGMSFYSDPSCTNSITSTIIPGSKNTSSFYFLSSNSGVQSLTVQAAGYRRVTQNQTILANPFIWTGGGADSNWSTGGNWSGGVPPNSTQQALFDGTCISNCSPTISSNISIAGIRMLSGFSGTITQSGGVTITIGTSGWYQASGSFVGSNSSISISGLLHILAGSFTSTSGNLSVATSFSSSIVSTVLKIANGVTFNANNGTIIEKAGYISGNVSLLNLDIDSSVSLNNLTIDPSSCAVWWYAGYGSDNHNAVIPLKINGVFNHACGWLSGTYKVSGDIIIGSSASGDFNAAQIELIGTGTQTYSYTTSGCSSILKINKPSGIVQSAVGTTDLCLTAFHLTQGSFTAPSGTLKLSTRINTYNLLEKSTGTTFTHNNGTVEFNPFLSNCSLSVNFNIDTADALALNNVNFNGTRDGCWGGHTNIYQTSAGITTILGTTSILGTGGRIYGSNLELQGDLLLSSTNFLGGTAQLKFTGSNTQNITTIAGILPTGNVTVNKTGGSIVQQSNVNWTGASQAISITAGTWNMNSYNLTTTGAISNLGSLSQGPSGSCGNLTYGSYSGNIATCP